jgi:hypothetical protein
MAGYASRTEQLRAESNRAADAVMAALERMKIALELSYRPDQPRIPAGNPGEGRWTDGDGGFGLREDAPASGWWGARESAGEARIQLVGQFKPSDMTMTVREFRAMYCKGYIRGVLPGEFEDMTLLEVQGLAKGGSAKARRCMKLLGEPRFRK